MTSYTVPKGTRDFLPDEMQRRNYIFQTISSVYQLYGFAPIETPAMENLSTLMGKYGEEGDRLVFKILNSGNFLENTNLTKGYKELTFDICERGLRYDLTVPFARFVVQHRNELVFPFKRYQIQPVWRGDRPQKGRYREFFQCDADIIGSNSLLNEFELIQIIDNVFNRLGIKVIIKLNNRKILAGIAALIGEESMLTDITVAIDKLDKIGQEEVNQALLKKGLSLESLEKLQPILTLQGSNVEKLNCLESLFSSIEIGLQGISEMRELFGFLDISEIGANIEFDLTLARGLNYYTGTIIEVKASDASIGSICGGGRYDNLTGIFGMPGISGVGISFGADRIYDVLNELNLFPEELSSSCQVLFCNFGKEEEIQCLRWANAFRQAGIRTEVYPESSKLKKQMAYADAKKIPHVILVGEDEIKEGLLTVKDMLSGKQLKLSLQATIDYINGK